VDDRDKLKQNFLQLRIVLFGFRLLFDTLAQSLYQLEYTFGEGVPHYTVSDQLSQILLVELLYCPKFLQVSTFDELCELLYQQRRKDIWLRQHRQKYFMSKNVPNKNNSKHDFGISGDRSEKVW
jgi:hypothetical protein